MDVLKTLVGTWTVDAEHRALPDEIVHGRLQVELMEGERFLVGHIEFAHEAFPNAVWYIGETNGLRLHYFDVRGVARLYDVQVDGDAWSYASVAPDVFPMEFEQRFSGTLPDATDSMHGVFQMKEPGKDWEDDLRVTYTRAS